MDTYRDHPEPARLPAAIHVLSEARTFKDPDTTGYYVGFIAGVLGANPKTAERLIAEILAAAGQGRPVCAGARHRLFRAAGVEGVAEKILAATAGPPGDDRGLSRRQGNAPTLDHRAEFEKPATWVEKAQDGLPRHKLKKPEMSFGQNPELLDTLWGQYFATSNYRSVWRIVAMLPWSKDRDSIEKLTIGSMAKVTLATNAARYPDVLALIQEIGAGNRAEGQPPSSPRSSTPPRPAGRPAS